MGKKDIMNFLVWDLGKMKVFFEIQKIRLIVIVCSALDDFYNVIFNFVDYSVVIVNATEVFYRFAG